MFVSENCVPDSERQAAGEPSEWCPVHKVKQITGMMSVRLLDTNVYKTRKRAVRIIKL